MQRIQNFTDQLKKFDRLHSELRKHLRDFQASTQPSLLTKLSSFLGGLSDGNGHATGQTPLRQIEKEQAAKDKAEEDKEIAEALAKWHTDGFIETLDACTNGVRLFTARQAEVAKQNDEVNSLLKLLEEENLADINRDFKEYHAFFEQAQRQVTTLNQNVQLSIAREYPELKKVNTSLAKKIDAIKKEIADNDLLISDLRKKYEDKASLLELINALPLLEHLKKLPCTEPLYTSPRALIEGTEWKGEWSYRHIPSQENVSRLLKEWNRLMPALTSHRDAFTTKINKYKQIKWLQYDERYQSIQNTTKAQLRFIDIDATHQQLAACIKPLLDNTLPMEQRQQKIELVESKFDELLASIDQQSAELTSCQRSINLIKEDVENEFKIEEVQHINKANISELVRSVDKLFQQYATRIKFANDMIKDRIPSLGREHSLALFAVFTKMFSLEAQQTICARTVVAGSEDDICSETERKKKIFAAAMVFIEEQKELFVKVSDKITATNLLASAVLEKIDNSKALAEAQDEVDSSLENQRFLQLYNTQAVEQRLNQLKNETSARIQLLKSKWLENMKLQEAMKKTFQDRQSLSEEKIQSLWEGVETIQSEFEKLKKLNQGLVIQDKDPARYKVIVEIHNQMLAVVKEVLEEAQHLFENEFRGLVQYAKELDEQTAEKVVKSINILLAHAEKSFKEITDDINIADAWLRAFAVLKDDCQQFSDVLPTLETHKHAIAQLNEKRAKSREAVVRLQLADDALLPVIPVSLSDIRKCWITDAFNYFQENYNLFLSAELERRRFTQEAQEWISALQPNHNLLREVLVFWFAICKEESQTEKEEAECRKKQTELYSRLDKLTALLELKKQSNISVYASLLELKKEVMGELNELKPNSQFSLAKVAFTLNELVMEKDSIYWEAKRAERAAFEASLELRPDHKEKSREKLARITELMNKFCALAATGDHPHLLTSSATLLMTSGAVDMYSNNPFIAAKNEAANYIKFINIYLEKRAASVQFINRATNEFNDKYYLAVQASLKPMQELKKQIEEEERTLEKLEKEVLDQDESDANEINKWRNYFNNEIAFNIVLNTEHRIDTETLCITYELSDLAKRLETQAEEGGVMQGGAPVELPDINNLKPKLAQAVANIIDKPNDIKNPDALIKEHRERLQACKADIEKSTRVAQRYVIDISSLEEERTQLTSIQARHQQVLLKAAQAVLSKSIYDHIVSNIQEPMTRLECLNNRMQVVKQAIERFCKGMSDLNEAKAKSSQLNDEYLSAALSTISKMLQGALARLQKDTSGLRKEWFAFWNVFQGIVSEKSGLNIGRDLIAVFRGLQTTFKTLRNGDDLSEVVKFYSHADQYKQMDDLLKLIIEKIDLPEEELNEFLLGCVEDFSAFISGLAKEEEKKIIGLYDTDMDKVKALYKWLLETSERIASFNVQIGMAQTNSEADIAALSAWMDRYVEPFARGYKALCDRAESIKKLDGLIDRLTREKNALPDSNKLKGQSKKIDEDLGQLEEWKKNIAKRVEQIRQLIKDETSLSKATNDGSFILAPRTIFLRFKYIFLANAEVKKILKALEARALEHEIHNEKPDNVYVIRELIRQLRECNTCSAEYVNLIPAPGQPTLTIDKKTMTLSRNSGGLTESAKLLQKLHGIMQHLTVNFKNSVYVEDVISELATQKIQLHNDTDYFLPEEKQQFELVKCIGVFHCLMLEEALEIETKHGEVVKGLKDKVQRLRSTSDDEITKLKKLREIIQEQYGKISESRGGIFNMYQRGVRNSRLAAVLEPFMERLDQVIGSYEAPVSNNPRPGEAVSSSSYSWSRKGSH